VDTIIDDVIANLSSEGKKLSKSISKQIANINDIMPTSGDKLKYRRQINKLKDFKKTVSGLENADIKIYNKIFDNIGATHFAKMLDMINELKLVSASDEAI
jgi:hypothetical protein